MDTHKIEKKRIGRGRERKRKSRRDRAEKYRTGRLPQKQHVIR